MKLSLQYPIKTKTGDVTEVDIRRIKGGDLLKSDKWAKDGAGDGEVSLRLVALLTDLSFEDAQELDADDITAISEVIENFSKKAKATADG